MKERRDEPGCQSTAKCANRCRRHASCWGAAPSLLSFSPPVHPSSLTLSLSPSQSTLDYLSSKTDGETDWHRESSKPTTPAVQTVYIFFLLPFSPTSTPSVACLAATCTFLVPLLHHFSLSDFLPSFYLLLYLYKYLCSSLCPLSSRLEHKYMYRARYSADFLSLPFARACCGSLCFVPSPLTAPHILLRKQPLDSC